MKYSFTKKLLGITALLVFLALAHRTLADFIWQTPWPKSPMGTDIGNMANPDVAHGVKYLYEWGIGLGGVAVFISIIIAGFEYITSIGNPTKMQGAFDRIRDAVIGLVILLSSYAILSLIGINLTAMKVDMFQADPVTLATECTSADGSPAPQCCQDSSGASISGCNPVFYTCKGYDPADTSSTGVCYPKSGKKDCGSADIIYNTGSPVNISAIGSAQQTDPARTVVGVVFYDTSTPPKKCLDITSSDPTVNDMTNPVCNCGLQVFTKAITTGGGTVSNDCENADIAIASNINTLKTYTNAKKVVCVELLK